MLCAFYHNKNERRQTPHDTADYSQPLNSDTMPTEWVNEFLAAPFTPDASRDQENPQDMNGAEDWSTKNGCNGSLDEGVWYNGGSGMNGKGYGFGWRGMHSDGQWQNNGNNSSHDTNGNGKGRSYKADANGQNGVHSDKQHQGQKGGNHSNGFNHKNGNSNGNSNNNIGTPIMKPVLPDQAFMPYSPQVMAQDAGQFSPCNSPQQQMVPCSPSQQPMVVFMPVPMGQMGSPAMMPQMPQIQGIPTSPQGMPPSPTGQWVFVPLDAQVDTNGGGSPTNCGLIASADSNIPPVSPGRLDS
jgi:hypothetical protein